MNLREIDTQIAEKVMGLPKELWLWGELPPSYSTGMAEAWKVVEKLQNDGFNFSLKTVQGSFRHYYACFRRWEFKGNDGRINHWEAFEEEQFADTAPLAICFAALKAVGMEVER